MPKRTRSDRHRSGDTETRKLRKIINNLDARLRAMEKQGRPSRSRIRRISNSPSSSSSDSSSRSCSTSDAASNENTPRRSTTRRSPFADALAENDVRSEEISFSTAPLSEDVIDILGKKDTSPEPLGPKIHEDLLLRWEKILKTGLSDDDRKSLLSKLPPPENFTTLSAPLLNPVVQKAISPSNLLRDERLTKLQSLVAASLSGIGQVCSLLLSEEGGGDRRYIELLNNAGRMLADLWHSQNITRRELISINLSKEFQEATKDIPLDTFLFGQNLDERMKATKSSEEYRKILKAKPPKTITKTRYQAPTSSQRFPATTRSLNHRAPSRYQQGTNRERSRYYNKRVPPQYRLKQQQHKQRGRPNR
ncbi:unnamed protein product [Acanthoscelides obtectus]|uniref:Uncharacterized protein n=1 Tax=Acanthoscelides obtectus TaxID=200917 RepID=A0A9P0JYH0_ACAOB|nr:unnamed protein product [Acanthoscelides obtectus]CAK1648734.1 hypothetical protein AOBTE_LOCUS15845 [Acanthoscelides obtectus]